MAVVPFGARAGDPQAGAWGRQLARRLVDRFAEHPDLELKPVFLVAMPERSADAAYLVFGSTPGTALAAQYGSALGTTHALVGLLRVDGERVLDATLVDVAARSAVATLAHPIPEGALPQVEGALATWLAAALGTTVPELVPPPNETAYGALLEGLDEEVNATLLGAGDPASATAARARAAARYLDGLRADAGAAAAEERLLVLAAESLERGEEAIFIEPLEELTAILPRSWRAHYLLGELRRLTGNTNGAVVALEHADALRPLRDEDSIRLAELYADAGADAIAGARLRRINPDSAQYGHAQDVIGVLAARRGDLAAARAAFERGVASGTQDGAVFARLAQVQAATGDLVGAVTRYREAVALGAPPEARLGLARALVAGGEPEAAMLELETLLRGEAAGELAAHARRLRLGLRRRDLEEALESAGQMALAGAEEALGPARADLERVIEAEPELWEGHFALGLIARRRGDAAASEHAFRRVLDLWPGQPDALHELGVALLLSDRTTEAVGLLDDAARLRPQDAGYVADAGFAQLRAGNLPAARERLTLARELDERDPITEAYLQELARIEATVGRPN